MHPADRLSQAEAATTPGIIASGEVLNAQATEISLLVPVVSGQAFGVGVADAETDKSRGLERLKTSAEGEGGSAHSLDSSEVDPESVPVQGPQHPLPLVPGDEKQIEIDACPLGP